MNHGYLMLGRSGSSFELLLDPNAFALLTLIALRARRTGTFSVYDLELRQALIGDYASCGLTRKQYRCAMTRLKRYGLADFKATSKGTIATLLTDEIYDINVETASEGPSSDEQRANEGRSRGHRTATNNNEKNEKKGKKGKAPLSSSSTTHHKTFAEMDQERVGAAWEQAEREFLAGAD